MGGSSSLSLYYWSYIHGILSVREYFEEDFSIPGKFQLVKLCHALGRGKRVIGRLRFVLELDRGFKNYGHAAFPSKRG